MASDFFGRTMRDNLPTPADSPALFESILSRRVFAFIIDCVIVGALTVAGLIAAAILGILTLGLAWLTFPLVGPLMLVLYYALTLGSSSRATFGMRAMDIVLTPTRDTPLNGWMAMIHVVLFWVSCSLLTPFVLLLGLFTSRRQLLHDFVAGVLMVRRSPMERRWAAGTGPTIEA